MTCFWRFISPFFRPWVALKLWHTSKPSFISMIIVETTVSDETAFHANWVVTKVSLLSYFASQLKVTYALLQCYLIITRINIFFVIFVVINQINKHKAKIYNHYTYTQIINFFSLQSIRMNGNSINFDNNKNKKIFNIDDIDVNKILVSK